MTRNETRLELALIELINACVSLGASGKTEKITKLFGDDLPDSMQEVLDKAKYILFLSEEISEIAPEVQGETFRLLPPEEFDPERDLPIGFLGESPKIGEKIPERHSKLPTKEPPEIGISS